MASPGSLWSEMQKRRNRFATPAAGIVLVWVGATVATWFLMSMGSEGSLGADASLNAIRGGLRAMLATILVTSAFIVYALWRIVRALEDIADRQLPK